MKKKWLSALLASSLFLLATGCSPAAPVDTEQEEEQEYPVVTQSIEAGSIEKKWNFVGHSEAESIVHVSPKIGGKIKSINVKEGDIVRAGQVLFSLDAKEYADSVRSSEAGLAATKAGLEQAKANQSVAVTNAQSGLEKAKQAEQDARTNLERIQALYDSGAATKQQLEQAQTALHNAELVYQDAENALATAQMTQGITVAEQSVQQSQVGLEIAKSNLANATVTAPQAGMVVDVIGKAGEMASAQMAVLKIVDLSSMQVKVNVPENNLSFFQIGTTLEVSFDSIGLTTTGKVSYVSPLSDENSKGYPVTIRLENPNQQIKHGMVAQVKLSEAKSEVNGLKIPSDALLKFDGKFIVYLLQGDRAVQKVVEVLDQNSASTLISAEGIKPGDTLIVKGHTLLQDGAKVRVVEE